MKYLINCSISAKKFFGSVKTSIIGALLKYEKSVEKDAIYVHDRVTRSLGPVALSLQNKKSQFRASSVCYVSLEVSPECLEKCRPFSLPGM